MTGEELRVLADEQAALRRVATLVARGAEPQAVFAAVTEEVGRLLPVDFAILVRFEADRTAVSVAAWGTAAARFPVGKRWILGGKTLMTTVFETGRPARIESYADTSEPVRANARDMGLRSSIATPIIVDGRVWGAVVAGSSEERSPPAQTEERLASFTALLATAIANAESRTGLRRLAEEQAALRRVATLVARGAAPAEVFSAVTEEVARVMPADIGGMARYEDDDTISVVASWGTAPDSFPEGVRLSLEGDNLSTRVWATGQPSRMDSYAESSGPLGAGARAEGVRSAVGTPITVEGRLWGLMVACSSGEEPLPADTEERLSQFTALLATAIANVESRTGIARLAEEQAGLRRVATQVARGATPQEVFAAVAEEVGQLLAVDLARLARYEPDRSITTLAAWGSAETQYPLGSRMMLGGNNLSTIVFQTGRPARIDSYDDASGTIGVAARKRGFRSSVGTPIHVEGRLWGLMIVGVNREPRLPAETEARLAQFTELLATAIANAESRGGLTRLAEEQAALRRVATQVAQGTAPEKVFAAVVEEVGLLLPVQYAHMGRYEPDEAITFVAAWGIGGNPFPGVGSRWNLHGANAATRVFETGRPARVDRYVDASGLVGVTARKAGFRSAVGSPIIVEGRLWGVILAGSTLEQPLPSDTEARLASFTELVATAIANAESHAALAASRARIVAAADATRRRIERDLHDGTQQRLVSLMLELRAARDAVPPEHRDLKRELSRISEGLEQVLEELREITRGIHPAILSRGGLEPALRSLARRSAMRVEFDLHARGRLPEQVEVAAYYAVSEALTNAVKHAQASRVRVALQVRGTTLRLEIRDDGIGGADPSQGSGLFGLSDRTEALGGTLRVTSPPGKGTTLVIEIPLQVQSSAA
ncbi:MAG TPA: GAF domain-containing protein [Solirubrobacteraceae bacterium]|nr:GAF domain-containing protein [Solirubrobacteraceae bacterium]